MDLGPHKSRKILEPVKCTGKHEQGLPREFGRKAVLMDGKMHRIPVISMKGVNIIPWVITPDASGILVADAKISKGYSVCCNPFSFLICPQKEDCGSELFKNQRVTIYKDLFAFFPLD